ncbi:AMP-binding protein [Parvibaculum sedimenti]|uniref:AMP-binding protein n=1 Tax=Parvibaculum sedimenti TaxID=2608632 RepID=A0A6N6VK03_9HYPH|nr:AMP-binding protein [Parvibaculum sedimenti]KAB7738833.1 AMP-binding protein [Parvibaculum sedimenti]
MSVAAEKTQLPPFKPLKQKPPKIKVEKKPDGTIYVSSEYPLGEMKRSIVHLLEEKAALHPDRNFIGERDASGAWAYITYGEANRAADAVATALLARGMGPSTPLLILSGNSITHAVMALGAMKARVPVAPVSVPYSLMSTDFSKLRHVFELTRPRMIFAQQGAMFERALRALDLSSVDVVSRDGVEEGAASFHYDTMIATPIDAAAVEASMDRIDHDTVAKYLFTSGSTGMPKGAIQTHRMMMALVAAQEALRTEEPDPDEIPQSLEWMPWNHISAGNISFNGNLAAGGTVHLDAGKPIPGLFDQTIRNLRDVSPRVFGSAPVAFAMLADAMEKDVELRRAFFRNLEYMGYGGATLSSDLYDRMQALAIAETGHRMPLTTMYGATETQGITVVHWVTERVGLIGLPLPGITLKLVPNGTKLEVRVKGPTITPGYLNDPKKTAEAFDEEGYYALGDAARFLDPEHPEEGIVFDGRVTEDFKLSSGTWVSTGTLRADVVAACSPLIQDAVICGLDKPYIALLAWPNIAAAKAVAGLHDSATPQEVVSHPKVVAHIREALLRHNKDGGGSSTRIARIHLMTEPPSIDGHEITDKGYVNQRATLDRRAHLVERLYLDEAPDDVIVV